MITSKKNTKIVDTSSEHLLRENSTITNIEDRIKELEKSNFELLAKISKSREERENLIKESARTHLKLEENCKILLSQLHRAQEQLEYSIVELANTHTQLKLYKENFINTQNSDPERWYYTDLKINVLKQSEPFTIEWEITNTYINNQLVPKLQFKTIVDQGNTAIVFTRSVKTALGSPFLRWPHFIEDAGELCCAPIQGPHNHGSNSILSSLSTTDWMMLQSLTIRLCELTSKRQDNFQLNESQLSNLHQGLALFKTRLEAWPKLIRYDDICLVDTIELENYQAIEISFKNPQVGEKLVGDFTYRIATAYEFNEPIDQHPRLEFPEESRNALQNWYQETHDDRGSRLELRFAKSGALDTQVWNRLSSDDQILIAALLGSADIQLSRLISESDEKSVPKESWRTVCQTMRKVLSGFASHTRRLR